MNKIFRSSITFILLIMLNCAFSYAWGDDLTGNDTTEPQSGSIDVSMTIPTSYQVTIPASVDIAYPSKTANITVSGSASIPSNKKLYVLLDESNGLYLSSSSGKTLNYSIETTWNKGEKISMFQLPESISQYITDIQQCLIAGGVDGSWADPSFNTTLTFNITTDLSTVPADTYGQRLTFYAFVE